MTPDITLYEYTPTRSARCRWTLLEAGLGYESRGNASAIIGSDELKALHPLGKLPLALIDGHVLFESSAICTAIADLVPESGLISPSGTWARALHDQWVSFAATEMECWLWSSEINEVDVLLPKRLHVPAVAEQNRWLFRRSAAVLDAVLAESRYLVEDRFTVTDIIVGYTVSWGEEDGLVDDFANLKRYLAELRQREHCTFKKP